MDTRPCQSLAVAVLSGEDVPPAPEAKYIPTPRPEPQTLEQARREAEQAKHKKLSVAIPHDLRKEIQQLEDMGFDDRAASIAALRAHKNSVPAALDALIRKKESGGGSSFAASTPHRHDRMRHGGSHPQPSTSSSAAPAAFHSTSSTFGYGPFGSVIPEGAKQGPERRALSPPPAQTGGRAKSQPAPVKSSPGGTGAASGPAVGDLLGRQSLCCPSFTTTRAQHNMEDLFSDPIPPTKPTFQLQPNFGRSVGSASYTGPVPAWGTSSVQQQSEWADSGQIRPQPAPSMPLSNPFLDNPFVDPSVPVEGLRNSSFASTRNSSVSPHEQLYPTRTTRPAQLSGAWGTEGSGRAS
ncbi:hypothetical protein HDU93_000003 [Gonapodya sp. JEL0774]|nr:hypothetical protein HDU93_000003 [Gonapodya sp. JEL0774]